MIIRKFQCRSNWWSDEVKRGRMVSLSYVPPPPPPPPRILEGKMIMRQAKVENFNSSIWSFNGNRVSFDLAWPGARQ